VLILFDIDATLLTTNRAGMGALGDAGRALFGERFTSDRTEFAGRLDPLIIRDLLIDNGLDPTPDHQRAMRTGYREHLARRLAVRGTARALEGAAELARAFAAAPGVTIGLLTGNFPETGRLKLAAAGLSADDFPLQVWGEDAPSDPPTRDDLPGVALRRYAESTGRELEPHRVVIIGDTIHDIACARAHGCRAIGVATGSYSRADLSSADLALDSLADVSGILRWALGA